MKRTQKAAGMLLGILAAGICMTAAAEEGKISKSTLLTGLVFQSVSDSAGLWSRAGAEKLEEDTGIRLEFYSNGGGNTQKLLQYLAAGTLPDIVGVEESQAVLLENAGLLVNLDTCQDQLGLCLKMRCIQKHWTTSGNSLGEQTVDYTSFQWK